MKYLAAAFVVALTGCATQKWVWDKPGSTQQDFSMDTGQCRAQAYSVPFAPLVQQVLVFENCMQGKGWHQRPA